MTPDLKQMPSYAGLQDIMSYECWLKLYIYVNKYTKIIMNSKQ